MLNQHQITTHSITGSLGIQGWSHLDAIILAAIVTESPILLVGPHGTAKSLLVELLSKVLKLEFRHYNASLLNYDDLVGIPIPEEANEQLKFVSTPDSIWDAEFVFFDEISRCRADLQNKLFPIIHERRVVGVKLNQLRHRWAAMNPPAPDEPDLSSATAQYYLGSEPLDPALVDRFPFIIPVPDWNDLSKEDRRRIVSLQDNFIDSDLTADFSLSEVVKVCSKQMAEVEAEHIACITDYLICVMDMLVQADLPQSPRRARMLARSISAVHAARLTLIGPQAELSDSVELVLLYGLPQNATDVPPSEATVVSAHRQAWEIANLMDNDNWRKILAEQDYIQRVLIALELELDVDNLSKLVTQSLGSDELNSRKMSLATAMFLRFRQTHNLTPAAWEFLVKLASPVLEPCQKTFSLPARGNDKTTWNEIRQWAIKRQSEGNQGILEVNYIVSGFPEMWQQQNWHEALQQFREDLIMFGVCEGKNE